MVLPELIVDGNLVVNGAVTSTGAMTPGAGVDVADTFTVHDPADPTKKARIDCVGITPANTRVLTAPDFDGTIATLAGAESFTNKTLTAPNVVTSINDANGAEVIVTPATAVAVNEVTITNAATGTAPKIEASGDDATVCLQIGGNGAPIVPLTRMLGFGPAHATIADASDQAILPAEVLSGKILRDCNGNHRQDTLPSAADLCTAIGQPVVGTEYEFWIRNTSGGAFTITIATPGADVTLSGTMTIAQSKTRVFQVRLTNVTGGAQAYTCYAKGLMDN